MTDAPVVIVGAGAAGIGAARRLMGLGIASIVLEATARAGGRALTASGGLSRRWDHGAHWLHSAATNPLVPLARTMGATFTEEDEGPPFRLWASGRFADQAEMHRARSELERLSDAIETIAGTKRDVAVADLMAEPGPWSQLVRTVFATLAREDADKVSASGYGDYADWGLDWPVDSGYGAVIEKLAEGLDIRFGAPVTGIREVSAGVDVVTPFGTQRARAVIVTVSTNVLSSGAIRFGPGAAADVAAGLIPDMPCGAYEKVAFELTELPGELNGIGFCTIDPGNADFAVETEVISGAVPMLITHLAGDAARTLIDRGGDALAANARACLRAAFGSGIDRQIKGHATTRWTKDPWVRGSYSHAKPGRAAARRAAIAAETGRILFAGEAFSSGWQATVHGAWQTGQDRADQIALSGWA